MFRSSISGFDLAEPASLSPGHDSSSSAAMFTTATGSLVIHLLIALRSPHHAQAGETTDASIPRPRQCTNSPAGPLTPRSPLYTSCPALVDDETAARTGVYSPWSLPPVCITARSSSSSSSARKRPKLCTFTSASPWAGHSALSIVTTPEIAAGVAHAVHDPDAGWFERERRAADFRFPAAEGGDGKKKKKKKKEKEEEEEEKQETEAPYEIRPVPGKGLGVVAAAPIPVGAVVMAEMPVLVQSMAAEAGSGGGGGGDGGGSRWEKESVWELLDVARRQLPRREREVLDGLARLGRGHTVEDAVRTNSLR
ncbi:hypothetical protein VTK26DRAFT_4107 [Humicola hyalothermophila]